MRAAGSPSQSPSCAHRRSAMILFKFPELKQCAKRSPNQIALVCSKFYSVSAKENCLFWFGSEWSWCFRSWVQVDPVFSVFLSRPGCVFTPCARHCSSSRLGVGTRDVVCVPAGPGGGVGGRRRAGGCSWRWCEQPRQGTELGAGREPCRGLRFCFCLISKWMTVLGQSWEYQEQ